MLRFRGSNHFRLRLVLSCLTGRPVRIEEIRADDEAPGLRTFEASFLRLVEKVSNGCVVEINETGAMLALHAGVHEPASGPESTICHHGAHSCRHRIEIQTRCCCGRLRLRPRLRERAKHRLLLGAIMPDMPVQQAGAMPPPLQQASLVRIQLDQMTLSTHRSTCSCTAAA